MSELLWNQVLYFPTPSITHSNKSFIYYKLKPYTDIHKHVHIYLICIYYPEYFYKDKSHDKMICSCFNAVVAFSTTCPLANLNASKMPTVLLLHGWLKHSTVNNFPKNDLKVVHWEQNILTGSSKPSKMNLLIPDSCFCHYTLINCGIIPRANSKIFKNKTDMFGGGKDLRESTSRNSYSWVHLVISVIMKFPHWGLRGWLISLVFSTACWVPHGQHWFLDWIHNNHAIPNGWV